MNNGKALMIVHDVTSWLRMIKFMYFLQAFTTIWMKFGAELSDANLFLESEMFFLKLKGRNAEKM